MRPRPITIVATAASSSKESQRHFIDTLANMPIRCAFNLREDCSPDCAACGIFDYEASCDRIGDRNSSIGLLSSKDGL